MLSTCCVPLRKPKSSLEIRRSPKTPCTLVIGADRPQQSSQGPTSSHSLAPAMRHRTIVICTFRGTAGINYARRAKSHRTRGIGAPRVPLQLAKASISAQAAAANGRHTMGFAYFPAGGSILMSTCCVPDSGAQKLAGNPPLDEKNRFAQPGARSP